VCTGLHELGNIAHAPGRSLTGDVDKERVAGDDEANLHLRQTYREPWVYPATE
jgi:hypothetical protein